MYERQATLAIHSSFLQKKCPKKISFFLDSLAGSPDKKEGRRRPITRYGNACFFFSFFSILRGEKRDAEVSKVRGKETPFFFFRPKQNSAMKNDGEE